MSRDSDTQLVNVRPQSLTPAPSLSWERESVADTWTLIAAAERLRASSQSGVLAPSLICLDDKREPTLILRPVIRP